MTLLTFGWNGGLVLLPFIGFGVSIYCAIRYSKNKSLIPFWVGALIGALSIAGLIALILDK